MGEPHYREKTGAERCCMKCWAGKHIPPNDDKELWVGRSGRCVCYPEQFCSQPKGDKMTAKDIDSLYNSTIGCKNCRQKFYPGCLDGSSPNSDMICRACIIYITNFDPNNKFIALAFKALNNMSTVNQTDDVYGPNDKNRC